MTFSAERLLLISLVPVLVGLGTHCNRFVLGSSHSHTVGAAHWMAVAVAVAAAAGVVGAVAAAAVVVAVLLHHHLVKM